jgi:hypothetical protein
MALMQLVGSVKALVIASDASSDGAILRGGKPVPGR